MKSYDMSGDRVDKFESGGIVKVRNPNAEHLQIAQTQKQALHHIPGTIPQIQSPQPWPVFQKPYNALEQRVVIVMAHKYKSECLEVRQERVRPVYDVVAAENDPRRTWVLKRAVQREAAKSSCMGNAREDEVRDAGVD